MMIIQLIVVNTKGSKRHNEIHYVEIDFTVNTLKEKIFSNEIKHSSFQFCISLDCMGKINWQSVYIDRQNRYLDRGVARYRELLLQVIYAWKVNSVGYTFQHAKL